MDDLDRAEAQASELLKRAIEYISSQQPLIVATGVCLNCEEPLPENHRWCDEFCRQDWERRQR